MRASDLQQKIAWHREALTTLSGRVDQIIARVEALTREAHEFLAEYQERKRAASEALGAAGKQFLLAQRAFRAADALVADLVAIKDIHIALSRATNSLLAQGDSAEARQILRDLMKIRRTLRSTCRRIERCRSDGLPTSDDSVLAQEPQSHMHAPPALRNGGSGHNPAS